MNIDLFGYVIDRERLSMKDGNVVYRYFLALTDGSGKVFDDSPRGYVWSQKCYDVGTLVDMSVGTRYVKGQLPSFSLRFLDRG